MFRGLGILSALSVSIFAQSLPELGSFTHEGRTIWYHVKEGMAVAEGDILLGPADSIDKDDATRAAAIPLNTNGSISTWTQGQIPYVIDANVPNQRRITDAIAHWNSSTPVRLLPRTGQANYVRFVRPDDQGYCASFVGMRGGEQAISLGDLCTTGSAIHEIGHAAGLLHEQDRLDRNRWVTIQYENLAKFDTPIYSQFPNTLDANYYNYDSIMHYSPYGFTRNQRPVILTVPLGIPIGIRANLSPGDLDTISRLYGVRPTRTTIATMPSGLQIQVDGQTYIAPQSFDWAEGSTHTVSVLELQTATTTATRHRFVRWTDGGAATHTFTATPNLTVIAATFSREHRVTVQVLEGKGTANLYPTTPDGYYPAGSKIRVNAIPEQTQKFFGWGTNFNLEAYDIGFSTREFEIDVYGNLAFGAFFTQVPLTTIDVAPNDYSYVVVDGVPWTPPIKFDWEPGSRHTISAPGTQFNDDGSMRYRFLNWADGSSASAREVVAGNDDATYTARYRAEAGVVLGSTSAGRLFINPGSTDGFFAAGTTLLLRAVPNANQDLIFWFGDINGRGRDRVMLMDQPRFAIGIFGAPVPFFPFMPHIAGVHPYSTARLPQSRRWRLRPFR